MAVHAQRCEVDLTLPEQLCSIGGAQLQMMLTLAVRQGAKVMQMQIDMLDLAAQGRTDACVAEVDTSIVQHQMVDAPSHVRRWRLCRMRRGRRHKIEQVDTSLRIDMKMENRIVKLDASDHRGPVREAGPQQWPQLQMGPGQDGLMLPFHAELVDLDAQRPGVDAQVLEMDLDLQFLGEPTGQVALQITRQPDADQQRVHQGQQGKNTEYRQGQA